jgi:hypothetical protein
MAPSILTKAFSWLGLLGLMHAAYSYRHYMKLLTEIHAESDAPSLPVDVIIELAASFLLIVVGRLLPMELKGIRISSDLKARSFDESFTDSHFMTFNHRGRELAKRK